MGDPFNAGRPRTAVPTGQGFQASMTSEIAIPSETIARDRAVVVCNGAAALCERLGARFQSGDLSRDQFFAGLAQVVRVLNDHFPQEFRDKIDP